CPSSANTLDEVDVRNGHEDGGCQLSPPFFSTFVASTLPFGCRVPLTSTRSPFLSTLHVVSSNFVPAFVLTLVEPTEKLITGQVPPIADEIEAVPSTSLPSFSCSGGPGLF